MKKRSKIKPNPQQKITTAMEFKKRRAHIEGRKLADPNDPDKLITTSEYIQSGYVDKQFILLYRPAFVKMAYLNPPATHLLLKILEVYEDDILSFHEATFRFNYKIAESAGYKKSERTYYVALSELKESGLLRKAIEHGWLSLECEYFFKGSRRDYLDKVEAQNRAQLLLDPESEDDSEHNNDLPVVPDDQKQSRASCPEKHVDQVKEDLPLWEQYPLFYSDPFDIPEVKIA